MMRLLYYYHDPMCSWCWAYRPTSDKLFASLPDSMRRVNILGGLAPDSDEPMPAAMQATISTFWQRIHDQLGTEFNFDFWQECEPRRSTYPACRAVIAAGRQDQEEAMIDAIQRAYYLRAMNPSVLPTVQLLAEELRLNTRQFAADISSTGVDQELQRQVRFARQSPISGFPSLALELHGELLPVKLDYESEKVTLDHLKELCAG